MKEERKRKKEEKKKKKEGGETQEVFSFPSSSFPLML
jgi:hypothetical protein